jgi:hypothetical protein
LDAPQPLWLGPRLEPKGPWLLPFQPPGRMPVGPAVA